MKRILILAFAMVTMYSSTQAQTQKNKAADKKVAVATDQDAQKKDKQEFFEGVELSPDQIVQLQEEKKAYKAKQLEILTPEQLKQLEEIKQKKKADMLAADQIKMKEMLSLSEAQFKKMKSIQANDLQSMANVKENASYSEEEKSNLLKEIKEGSKEERMSILNADQKKKMEAYEKEMKEKKATKLKN